ncbi:ribosome biogenesis GTPase Der [Deferribacter thermophilus]|uniref:ribosome biogenesis GTPase Der n=1 Tax=Deferribacter thermophilus TaxID=53573 RepID=UPI003C20A4A7
MFTVGIIGRPNVGKSTLFNRFAGKRIAIVDDIPGVTRDRIEHIVEWEGKKFKVIDTCGYDLREELLKKEMIKQFYASLEEADFFILLVDAKEGVHPLDEIVCNILREKGKNFIVAVNKVDNDKLEAFIADFYQLGVDEIIPISATHGRNIDMILDKILENYHEKDDVDLDYGESVKIVVVGRPNVGKSSLINSWLGDERLIVTPIPGTTRDSVDVFFNFNSQQYVLIDTAGIRKKSVMFKDRIEKYGYYRSYDSIQRADIAVGVIDATEGVTEKDVKIIADAYEAGRPVIIAVNKWDAVKKDEKIGNKFKSDINEKFKFLNNPPVVFVSALTGKNIFKIFDAVNELYKEYTKRIQTSKLNKLLEEVQYLHQPPVVRNRRVKFYYMTQVDIKPPHFVIFVNYPEAVHFSYKRFIVNQIRENFGFKGVPLVVSYRKRGEEN